MEGRKESDSPSGLHRSGTNAGSRRYLICLMGTAVSLGLPQPTNKNWAGL